MKVEIWSDVACPWCYVGKRRLEAALASFAHRDQVDVVWRSFELDPTTRSAEPGTGAAEDYAHRLATKYRTDRAGAQRMLDTMTGTGAAEGLTLDFGRAVAANTFDAHQVIHLAADRGLQEQVKERLFRAHLAEGEALGDRETLVRLAADAGLDPDEVRVALEEQRYASAVRDDEAEAQALGVTGVPFFVIDRKYGVSGAQPAEVLGEVLARAWGERSPLTVVAGDGVACGPEGCD